MFVYVFRRRVRRAVVGRNIPALSVELRGRLVLSRAAGTEMPLSFHLLKDMVTQSEAWLWVCRTGQQHGDFLKPEPQAHAENGQMHSSPFPVTRCERNHIHV